MFPALLHAGHGVSWSSWHLEPTVLAGALVAGGLYVWSLRSAGQRTPWWRPLCFVLGAGAMLLALTSPLDAAAGRLLSMHMLQHVLLTSVGPPLVLLGVGPAQLGFLLRPGPVNRLARALLQPLVTAALFIVNMWFWHLPAVYGTALAELPAHVTMHLAFMATGLLFWWPVVQPLPGLVRLGEGARLLYLFVTGFPMGLLALLLLSSGKVLYGYYETPPYLWGIEPLVDQQVAGVIMGALGEAASFVAITYLFFRFLDREGQEAEPAVARDAASAP